MAKMTFVYPIDEMHGKLKGKFGVAQRKEANQKGERMAFSVNYGTRKAEYSSAETAAHTRFATLVAMYKLRKTTSATRIADQTAFKAQSQYKTLKAYIFAQCKAELDAEDEEEETPGA